MPTTRQPSASPRHEEGRRSRPGRGGGRAGRRLDLTVESSTRRNRGATVRWPWPLVVIVGALLAVVAQWAVLGALLVPEWLGIVDGHFPDLLTGAGQLWLLAHGVPMQALGMTVSVAPLGLTAVILLTGEETCRYGARVLRATRRRDHARPSRGDATVVAALHASVHLAAAVVIASAVGADRWWRVCLGAVLVGITSGVVGAWRGTRRDVRAALPSWARPVPAGIAVASAVVLAGGAAALTASLAVHAGRVVDFHRSLDPGAWGGVVLVLIGLAWLPNAVLWAGAWCLGPGFSLGVGTWASPLGVRWQLVPGLPLLGGLPDPGLPSPWQQLWFLVPVAAAALGTVVVTRQRPEAGFERTTGLGIATGAGGGLAVGLLAAFSGGSLGTGRLAHVGPALPATLAVGVGVMTLAGMATGFAVGSLRWHRDPANRAVPAEVGTATDDVPADAGTAAGGHPGPPEREAEAGHDGQAPEQGDLGEDPDTDPTRVVARSLARPDRGSPAPSDPHRGSRVPRPDLGRPGPTGAAAPHGEASEPHHEGGGEV